MFTCMYHRKRKLAVPIPCSRTETPTSRVSVLWRKKSRKLHKSWEGDGKAQVVQSPSGDHALRIQIDGYQDVSANLGRDCNSLRVGEVLSAGPYEVEVTSIDPAPQQLSDHLVLRDHKMGGTVKSIELATPNAPLLVPRSAAPSVKSPHRNATGLSRPGLLKTNSPKIPSNTLAQNLALPFVVPGKGRTVEIATEVQKFDENMLSPFLKAALRPHQVEAVRFMYNSVLGLQHHHGNGCILADEMGLGKTLSTIACIYTLVRQRQIDSVAIVCPATLITSWRNEFQKWIPAHERFGVLAFDQNQSHRTMDLFLGPARSRVYQVLIIGYERVRSISALETHERKFDLLVCDEAHRLKSRKSKTGDALDALSGEKRILLTGTPIQNDLTEFHALANFANMDCLGPERQFRALCEQADTEEVSAVCEVFMLRRTASVLAQYVSVEKHEHLVFVRMTEQQRAAYVSLTRASLTTLDEGCAPSDFLQTITELRKIASGLDAGASGKLLLLRHFLLSLSRKNEEKVVIVSGSTRVLDMCQELCTASRFSWLRLDGSTPVSKRQSSVTLFNRLNPDAAFVFLLSTRSGGAGLNLTGASRLLLLDGDWNPAMDAQAVARIYRDGQKRPCHIYRFLSTGTIDEKIFQRQLRKLDISHNILADENMTAKMEFTTAQLRDLFTFKEYTKCSTLDTRHGESDLRGYKEAEKVEAVVAEAMQKAQNVTCVLTR